MASTYKHPITYQDFDGNNRKDILEFNITSTELGRNLTILDELERLEKQLDGVERDMTNQEKQDLWRLLERIVGLSFGVRSDDGRYFRKGEGVLQDFQSSAMYDPFFMGLMENKDQFEKFMAAVVPERLKSEAREQAQVSAPVIELMKAPPEPRADNDLTIEELKKRLASAERSEKD